METKQNLVTLDLELNPSLAVYDDDPFLLEESQHSHVRGEESL